MPDSAEENVACRICMDSKDNYVYLLSHDLSKKLMEISDVQVEKDDGLPDVICTECESDLEKCYEFRIKVQVADKKFRENIRFSQVDIEEYNIKEERDMDDGSSENIDDRDSVSMDEEHCNDEPEVLKNREETEEAKPDPLNHVVVVEGKRRKIEMSEDPLIQDEAMIEEPQVKTSEEPAPDPLFQVCKKEESEADIMDVEGSQTDPFGPSSSVSSSESSKTNAMLSLGDKKGEGSSGQLKKKSYLLCGQVTSNTSLPLSPLRMVPTSSMTPMGLILPVPVNTFMPGDPKCYNNFKPKVKSVNRQFHNPSSVISVTNPVVNTSTATKNNIQLNNSIAENIALSKPTNCCEPEFIDLDEIPTPGSSSEATTTPLDKNVKAKDESFCRVCNVSCGSVELLQEHKERKGFICRTCTSSFDCHVELESHFVTHTPFKCKMCGEIFHFKKDLYRHRNSGSCTEPLNYNCDLCNKKFLRSTQLRTHMWTHKKVQEENIESCIVCKKKFKNSQFLMAHGRSSHLVYEYLECTTCNKLLLGPGKLRCHVQTVHIEPSEDTQFPCLTCRKIYTNKSALNSHILDKHDETQYVCEVCAQSITGKKAMHAHMKYKHLQQTFTCTLCNQQFNTKAQLSTHRKHHIKKERPPKAAFCEICGKTYKTERILKVHLQIHSDEKPFMCEVCGAAFKQKTILQTHKRVHNSVGKYSCDECGLSFNWKQTFEKHVANCEGSNGRDNDTDSS